MKRINKVHLIAYGVGIILSIISYFIHIGINISFKDVGFIFPIIVVTLLESLKFLWVIAILGIVTMLLLNRDKEKDVKFEQSVFCITVVMIVMGLAGIICAKGFC